MAEHANGAPGPHPAALEIGKKVVVAVEVKLSPDAPWQSTSYKPWVGRIVDLPKINAVNGNVNVMPEEPRGDRFPSMHPRVIDLSPRPLEATDGIEVRHVLHDFDPTQLGAVVVDPPQA